MEVDITVVAPGYDSTRRNAVRSAIIAYMLSLQVGASLTRDYLIYIIVSCGITTFDLYIDGSVTTTEEHGDIDAGYQLYERVWPYNTQYDILHIENNYTVAVVTEYAS
jgi:hypothetical protein